MGLLSKLVDKFTGDKGSKKAERALHAGAEAAKGRLISAEEAGVAGIRRGFGGVSEALVGAEASLTPYMQRGVLAEDKRMALSGALGPEAQRQAEQSRRLGLTPVEGTEGFDVYRGAGDQASRLQEALSGALGPAAQQKARASLQATPGMEDMSRFVSSGNQAARLQEALSGALGPEAQRAAQVTSSGRITAGTQASEMQAALSGALGPEAQAKAFQQYQESPEVAFAKEQGMTGIRQDSSRTGVGGGTRMKAIGKFLEGTAMQDFANQYARLGGIVRTGQEEEAQQYGRLGDLSLTGRQASEALARDYRTQVGDLGTVAERGLGIRGTQMESALAQEAQQYGRLGDIAKKGDIARGDLLDRFQRRAEMGLGVEQEIAGRGTDLATNLASLDLSKGLATAERRKRQYSGYGDILKSGEEAAKAAFGAM